jgi:hypothetical protein
LTFESGCRIPNLESRSVCHFNRFAFRHQLRRFPSSVSINVRIFRISQWNLVLTFRILAQMHFGPVPCLNLFAFLHRLTCFRDQFLPVAQDCRRWNLNRVVRFRISGNLHLKAVHHFS